MWNYECGTLAPAVSSVGVANDEFRTPHSALHTPIIAVSASVFEETRTRALATGFNDFLIKPFDQENLVKLLQTYLRVEWIYEEAGEEAQIDVQPEPEPVQFAPLPPEETATLLELARLGIAKQLLSVLSTIEHQDAKSLPIVKKLRQLTKNYQFDQIIELLETQKIGSSGKVAEMIAVKGRKNRAWRL